MSCSGISPVGWGLMDLDQEWSRVRVRAGLLATDRYSWLRPADPSAIAFRYPDSFELVHVEGLHPGPRRVRAVRVDEAHGVADAQFAIDEVHSLDRRFTELRFQFHPESRVVSLRQSPGSLRLDVVRSQQNLGLRWWWACPVCGRRCRYVYFFEVGRRADVSQVLACRTCLGLTYASRARHRCTDQDRRAEARGDEAARERQDRRRIRRAHQDGVQRDRLAVLVGRLRRRAEKLLETEGAGMSMRSEF
jgi:hypothetical protein